MSTLNRELYEALIEAGAIVSAGIMDKLKKHDYMLAGLYITGGAGFGYLVSLLNTIIDKL